VTGWVLYSPEMGVFVGSCMGLGFWSNLDPVDQPRAPALHPEEWAVACADWDTPPPPDAVLRSVEHSQDGYASRGEIALAGLPVWASEGGDDGIH